MPKMIKRKDSKPVAQNLYVAQKIVQTREIVLYLAFKKMLI